MSEPFPGDAGHPAPDRASHEPGARKRRRRGRLACGLGLVLSCLGLILGRLADLWIGFDVFAQFTAHFALGAVAFVAGLVMPRARVLTALVVMLAGLLGLGLWPHYVSEEAAAIAEARAGERRVRLMTFNTLFDNARIDEIAAEVERIDADIVTLLEIGPAKRPMLERLKARYPHRADCLSEDYCNLVILSKFPIVNSEARVGWDGPPVIRATFGPELGGLSVFGVHTIRFPHQRAQYKQITELAKLLENFLGNRAVMGDFNATPYSRIVRTLEERTGLHRLSHLPTWPARLKLPQLAIDHIFVSTLIRTLEPARIGRNAGSDHYPVIVTVAVPVS